MASQKAWKARDATKRQLDFSTEFLGAAWEVAGERHRYKMKGGEGKAVSRKRTPIGNKAGIPRKVKASAGFSMVRYSC